ncbi:hypothetical protein CY35_11G106600 [Sphagnum magellanicum]|nr:hypothetical protein CY35_11G106600 [Sphagnum magellanicum]
MVDSLLSALETNPTSSIQLLKTQTIPSFPMFTCTNCKCDVCRWIIQLGYFAPVETTIFRHILNNDTWENGAMVVDVGANVGYFSAYATMMGCRVASFEPNPHPRQFLLATSSIHDLHHTKWQVNGVQENEVLFTTSIPWGAGHIARRMLQLDNDFVKVQVIPLHKVVKEDVVLLKIDTEGYEKDVIEGSEQLFKNHVVHNVVIEVKNFNDPDKRDFMHHLKEIGHFTHVYSYHDSYDYDRISLEFEDLKPRFFDVTEIIGNKKYHENVPYEDLWFCKQPISF